MIHRASSRFLECYGQLPEQVKELANKCFALLRENPNHPSLRLKKIGKFWSVRIGIAHRALGIPDGRYLIWVWIGTHEEYERLLKSR